MLSTSLLGTLFLIITCYSIHNPGIVIQIPDNLSLPHINLHLPQYLPSIVAQKLQLNSNCLKTLQYNWKLINNKFIIYLQKTLITFNWIYGNDQGYGNFYQLNTNLEIIWSLNMTQDARFNIDVDNAQITNSNKNHSIKIHLGGNIPESVVIIVTNLILNHAKSIFRLAIKNTVAKAVQSFTEPLRHDLKIICTNNQDNTEKCIYINTTLVSKPLNYNGIQYMQINGAPYKSGSHSGFLDPSQAIIGFTSKLLDLQIHQKVFTQLSKIYLQISPISKTINLTDISDIVDANSFTLVSIFPKMNTYPTPRPVLLTLFVNKLDIVISNLSASLSLIPQVTAKIQTEDIGNKTSPIIPYIDKILGQLTITMSPILAKLEASIRVSRIRVNKLEFDKSDVSNHLVNPQQINKYINTVMKFVEQGINGNLNFQKIGLEYLFAGIHFYPIITAKTTMINLQLQFSENQQSYQYEEM